MTNLARLIGSFGGALHDCCGVPVWGAALLAAAIVYGGFVGLLRTLQWADER